MWCGSHQFITNKKGKNLYFLDKSEVPVYICTMLLSIVFYSTHFAPSLNTTSWLYVGII